MIRRYLGLGASAVDFYTDVNAVIMVRTLFDCSSQPYVTITESALHHNPHYRSHRHHNKVIVMSVVGLRLNDARQPNSCKE